MKLRHISGASRLRMMPQGKYGVGKQRSASISGIGRTLMLPISAAAA